MRLIVIVRLLDAVADDPRNDLPSACCRRGTGGPCVLARSIEFLYSVFDNFMSACSKYCSKCSSVEYSGDTAIAIDAVSKLWNPLCRYLSRAAQLTPTQDSVGTASDAVLTSKLLRSLMFHRLRVHKDGCAVRKDAPAFTSDQLRRLRMILCMSRAPTSCRVHAATMQLLF